MPKFVSAARKSNLPGVGFSAATLAMMPVCAIAYMLVLLFSNWAKIDYRFFRSLPIISLLAYFVFAAASVTWAYSPDYAFGRLVVQVLAFIVIVTPYALPIRTKYTVSALYLCYAVALAISAVYVLTTPPSAIGHPGYFEHKQQLGQFSAVSIILS